MYCTHIIIWKWIKISPSPAAFGLQKKIVENFRQCSKGLHIFHTIFDTEKNIISMTKFFPMRAGGEIAETFSSQKNCHAYTVVIYRMIVKQLKSWKKNAQLRMHMTYIIHALTTLFFNHRRALWALPGLSHLRAVTEEYNRSYKNSCALWNVYNSNVCFMVLWVQSLAFQDPYRYVHG